MNRKRYTKTRKLPSKSVDMERVQFIMIDGLAMNTVERKVTNAHVVQCGIDTYSGTGYAIIEGACSYNGNSIPVYLTNYSSKSLPKGFKDGQWYWSTERTVLG